MLDPKNYLFIGLCLIFFTLVIVIRRRELARYGLFTAVLFGLVGIIANPIYLNNFSMILEPSYILGVVILGIGMGYFTSIIYFFINNISINTNKFKTIFSIKLLLSTIPLILYIVFSLSGNNPHNVMSISLLVLLFGIFATRKDLIKKSITTGILLVVTVIFISLIKINFAEIFLIEQIIFYFLHGCVAGIFFDFISDLKQMDQLV